MIWTEGLDNLKIFVDYLNSIHSTIKFTSSHSATNVPFLDVNVSLTNDGNICTDLYTKPSDKHQHLLYSSCHPLHTKKAIPFSLALRLRRICSTDETFNTRAAQLTTVEPRFSEVAGDWPNSFVKSRVRCIDVLFHTFYYCWGKEYRSLYRGFR